MSRSGVTIHNYVFFLHLMHLSCFVHIPICDVQPQSCGFPCCQEGPERQTQPAAQVPVRGKAFLFSGMSCLGKQLVRVLSLTCGIALRFPAPIVPTLPFFPRIYKNVYCSGTTIKLTILHKDPSVKGFSCVFSHFCASLRQIFLLLSSHGLSLENRTDIWRCLPPSDFPEKAFSGKFGKSGQAPRRQARKMGIPPGSPALS